jgi:hypothetical protein
MTLTREQKFVAKVAEAQFAQMAESDVADALNAPDTTLPRKRVDVPIEPVKTMFLQRMEFAALQMLAEREVEVDEDHPEFEAKTLLRKIAITAFATLTDPDLSVIPATSAEDYTNTTQMLGALLQAGVISQQTFDQSVALADVPQSWAEANEFPDGVTAGDVGKARGDN